MMGLRRELTELVRLCTEYHLESLMPSLHRWKKLSILHQFSKVASNIFKGEIYHGRRSLSDVLPVLMILW
jgi:hypothetical protein